MSTQNTPQTEINNVSEQPDSSPPLKDSVSTPALPTQRESSSYCALIVDDNVGSQKLLALSLSMQPQIGIIDFAESGEIAMNKATQKLYDFIFLDVMLPGIDGYETCARLRKMPEYKFTPIIMVTGLTEPMDEAKGIIAGSTTYVTKPVQQIPFKRLITRELARLAYNKAQKELNK